MGQEGGEEGDDEDEAAVENAGSSVGISSSLLSCASKRSVNASTTSTAREVEEQLRNEAGWGQETQGEVVERSSQTPVHKEQRNDEESYDDGVDYLLSIGSFSTPPLPGAQVPLASETSLQAAKLSDGKPIALSTLGKRFLDHLNMSQEPVSPLSSSSPLPPAAKKPRLAGTNNSAFTTPTGPTEQAGPSSAQHPSLIHTEFKFNIPPHISPHTPASAFSNAAAIHAARLETPTNIWSLLRPCPLADLPSRPHGSKVDILAIIYSIDTNLITRNKSVKRDCCLVDPTSPPLVPTPTQPHLKQPHHNELKPTILSVWVKPQVFIPRVGTLVAFRGLTVHRYAGRSLNAFSDVAGSVWYLVNPGSEIDGAEDMGEWWTDRCMREAVEELERKEEREKRERKVDGGGREREGWK
ncbi:hypothetical protein BGX38DRAFT_390458 [Terfezia claveryi]|nr:hypothetical protein BGX38DRAFT_390458 [Terfezia claveryi]